ncbi:MAG: peptidoglycan-binding domain-containing protein [Paracoccaceae bacterium]
MRILEDFRAHVIDHQGLNGAEALYAEKMGIAAANIASDCFFGTGNPGPFGINDLKFSREMVFRTALVVSDGWLDAGTSLALALAIDQTDGHDDGRYLAAARLLLFGAKSLVQPDENKISSSIDFYQNLLPRFSRETIVEAQRILKEYGFYPSSLDGVPGPAFRKAMLEAKGGCHYTIAKEHSLYCLPYGPELRNEDWLKPYLLTEF